MPHLPLTRFLAADQLHRLGPAELAFCDDEVPALAAFHGVSAASLQSAEGWPALTRLAITVGAVASTDYLLEEVAAGLAPDEARVLAVVIIGRGESAPWLAHISGVADLRRIAERLPLVIVSPDGTVAAHELWFPALASLVDQATRVEIAAAVARRASVRHAFDEA